MNRCLCSTSIIYESEIQRSVCMNPGVSSCCILAIQPGAWRSCYTVTTQPAVAALSRINRPLASSLIRAASAQPQHCNVLILVIIRLWDCMYEADKRRINRPRARHRVAAGQASSLYSRLRLITARLNQIKQH